MKCGEYKIDLGCGRNKPDGYIGIDRVQYIDGEGREKVDIVRDVEKMGLPFCDNSAVEVRAYNVLEHLFELETVMNECHRVLKKDSILFGVVPLAGTPDSFRDPTHKRFFNEATFDYFTGKNLANEELPSHPRWAKYDFLPWIKKEIKRDGDLIYFKMFPRK